MNRKSMAGAAIALMASLGAAAAQAPGVTADQVLIGVPIDFSGPLAEIGRAGANGVRMAEEEINAAGGINGRKLKFLFEDQAYDPKKSVLVVQKFIEQDKVFAIFMSTGTAPAAAAYPTVLKAGIPHVCPSTGAAMFSTPMERLGFACFPTNGSMISAIANHFVEKEGKKRFCFIYQDDEYGTEVKEGLEKVLAKANLKIIEESGYKRGATDFSGQVARVQRGACDILVLGAVAPPAAAIMQELRRRDWSVTVIGAGPTFAEETVRLGKEAVEGLYSVGPMANPDVERSPAPIRDWARKFQAKYNQPPGLAASYGYFMAYILAEGIKNAGPNLTVDSFVKGMEAMKNYRTLFGVEISYSDKNRLGAAGAKLFRVEGGRWVESGDLAPAL